MKDAQARNPVQQANKFPILEGVRSGDTISQILFASCLGRVFTKLA